METLKAWLGERFLDKLWAAIKEITGRIQVNYEGLLKKACICCVAVSLLCLTLFGYIEDYSMQIVKSHVTVEEGEITRAVPEAIWEKRLQTIIAVIMVLFNVFLFAAWGMLSIEKTNNHREYIRQQHERTAIVMGVASDILDLSHTSIPGLPKRSDFESAKNNRELLQQLRNKSLHAYMKRFDEYCGILALQLVRTVCSNNPRDEINISIKLFWSIDEYTTKVITVGRAKTTAAYKIIDPEASHKKDWKKILKNSYTLQEDYVLSLLTTRDACDTVFTCGDLAAFKNGAKSVCSISRANGHEYRIPSTVCRTFNATIVCPILITESDDTYRTVGAICADTTNSYVDWNKNGSCEEALISYAAANMVPTILHSMEMVETENTLIEQCL